MAFRFANFMFEPVWNRNYIDHIQITAAEDIGIGSRAGYYDSSGALRDLVQNHMLQLLTLLCMEPPASFEADKVRDEKVKVLHAITPPTPEEVARDDGARAVHRGRRRAARTSPATSTRTASPTTRAPRPTPRCGSRSTTGAGRACRSSCAPASGSRARSTEIAVQLKPVPHLAFQSDGSVGVQPNQLILTVQPNEGVSLSLGAKIPGSRMRIRPVNMEFLYGSSFMSQSPGGLRAADPRRDARRGDAVHAQRRGDRAVVDHRPDPAGVAGGQAGRCATYEAGSPGPAEADELIAPREWRGL